MESELWRSLSRDIAIERTRIIDAMAIGRYRGENDKYCEAVGYLAALQFIEDSVRNVQKRYQPQYEEINAPNENVARY